MTLKMYIVNDFDAPIPRLIAEEKDGELFYINPSMQERWAGRPMQLLYATKLEDFGIRITVEEGTLQGTLDPKLPVTAKYQDGKPRKWQGPSQFSFEYPPKPVNAPFNVLDIIPNPRDVGASEYSAIHELLDSPECFQNPEFSMAVMEEVKLHAQNCIDLIEAALLERVALGQ